MTIQFSGKKKLVQKVGIRSRTSEAFFFLLHIRPALQISCFLCHA